MENKKWTLKYIGKGEPPVSDLELLSSDNRLAEVLYSCGILTCLASEEAVVDILTNVVKDWRTVLEGKFDPAN